MAGNKKKKAEHKIILIISVFAAVVLFSIFIYYIFIFLNTGKTPSNKSYPVNKPIQGTGLKIKGYREYPVKTFEAFFKNALKGLEISKSNIITQNINLDIKTPHSYGKGSEAVHLIFIKYNILIPKTTGFKIIKNVFNEEFRKFIIPSKVDFNYYLFSVKNNCLCFYFYYKSKLFLKAVFLVKGIKNSGFDSINEYVKSPKIALDIDDVGYARSYINSLISLRTPITFAIFPYASYSRNIDIALHKTGFETIMHMPMEPVNTSLFPGKGALFVYMGKKEIKQKIFTDINRLPYIDGANNHEGSLFTSNKKKICDAVSDFKEKKLFFMDSLTDDNSYAYRCSLKQGIPAAERDVFIDDRPSVVYIKKQMDIAAFMAKKYKRVIAIGHPRNDTVKALMQEIPLLKKEGYMFVPLCEFLR